MPPPPALSDIVFSEQANHNFSRILGELKKSNLSIANRLNSILQDAVFVDEVASIVELPLVANERCGSWYVDPHRKAGSAYFKSTDGHAGQWQFSTRRLNLHLFELIGKHDGCIIVDSTRRGKRIPDSLSKTVPIWCCVLNRVLFPDDPAAQALHVPPNAVSESEKSQIEARVPAFIDSFRRLEIDINPLRQRISKPLRPIWATQGGPPPEPLSEALSEFHTVLCCTSSRRVAGTEMSEGGYIQGAGDDTEAWAHGLTAPLFWRHKDELLSASESDLPDIIFSLVANAEPNNSGAAGLKRISAGMTTGTLPVDVESLDAGSCLVALLPKVTASDTWIKSQRHMEVGLGKSKTGSRMLRDALPSICQFVSHFLGECLPSSTKPTIVVACESGKDLSIGAALALDCRLFDADGNMRPAKDAPALDKTAIRIRLGRIMQAVPEANPSRATLQSVNSFLMDWRR